MKLNTIEQAVMESFQKKLSIKEKDNITLESELTVITHGNVYILGQVLMQLYEEFGLQPYDIEDNTEFEMFTTLQDIVDFFQHTQK